MISSMKLVSLSQKALSFLSLVILFLASGCYIDLDDDRDCVEGRGSFSTDVFDFSEFNRVSNSLDAEIRITTGRSNHSVTITAQNNVLDQIEVRTRGSELILESDRCIERGDVQIDIALSELKGLFNAGSADIVGTNIWETDDLVLNLSGSGSISAILEVADLDVSIAGSGVVDVSGMADDVQISIAGSGDYEGYGLESVDTDVTIAGSGNAEILVFDELTGAISGSGRVFYKGDPGVVDITITGSGRVENRD